MPMGKQSRTLPLIKREIQIQTKEKYYFCNDFEIRITVLQSYDSNLYKESIYVETTLLKIIQKWINT